MRKPILLFLFFFSIHTVFAQKQVVLEKIRCFSSNRPVADYLEDADVRKAILSGLYQTLQKHQQLSLTDTNKAKIQFLDFNFVVPRIQPDYKDTDTSRLHLYLDILEMDPFYFFRNPNNTPSDTTMPKRVKAVFTLTSWFLDADKKIKETSTLTIVITPAETPGLGILYNLGIRFSDLAILPKVFVEFLRVGSNILLDPKSEVSLVEMKLQPAFFADNYILTKTFGQPRTYVVNNKNISTYHLGNKTEMIRLGDPLYEKVVLKGKKAQKYPADITEAIKSRDHFLRSDYVFLRQDCRDVLRDKNYLVKLAVEVDPNSEPDESSLLTNFIPGNFHYLLNENDTVAKFTIRKNFPGKN